MGKHDKRLITKMTEFSERIDKLYDKILPMYRDNTRSYHKYYSIQGAIKKKKREIQIMKTKASSTTKKFNRSRKKSAEVSYKEFEYVPDDFIYDED